MADNNLKDDWEDVPVEQNDDWEDIPEGGTATEAFAAGALKGGTLGFADEISAAFGTAAELNKQRSEEADAAREQAKLEQGVESPWDIRQETPKLADLFTLKDTTEQDKVYEELLAEERAKVKELEEAHPIASLAGNVAGGVVTGAALAPIVSGVTGLGATGSLLTQAALEGGTFAAGESEADNLGDLAEDVAVGTGLGLTTAGVGLGVGKVAKKGMKALAESVPAQKFKWAMLGKTVGKGSKELGEEISTLGDELQKSVERSRKDVGKRIETLYDVASTVETPLDPETVKLGIMATLGSIKDTSTPGNVNIVIKKVSEALGVESLDEITKVTPKQLVNLFRSLDDVALTVEGRVDTQAQKHLRDLTKFFKNQVTTRLPEDAQTLLKGLDNQYSTILNFQRSTKLGKKTNEQLLKAKATKYVEDLVKLYGSEGLDAAKREEALVGIQRLKTIFGDNFPVEEFEKTIKDLSDRYNLLDVRQKGSVVKDLLSLKKLGPLGLAAKQTGNIIAEPVGGFVGKVTGAAKKEAARPKLSSKFTELVGTPFEKPKTQKASELLQSLGLKSGAAPQSANDFIDATAKALSAERPATVPHKEAVEAFKEATSGQSLTKTEMVPKTQTKTPSLEKALKEAEEEVVSRSAAEDVQQGLAKAEPITKEELIEMGLNKKAADDLIRKLSESTGEKWYKGKRTWSTGGPVAKRAK